MMPSAESMILSLTTMKLRRARCKVAARHGHDARVEIGDVSVHDLGSEGLCALMIRVRFR